MIRRALREIGRAPVRILTSVIALALAVGAIGVLAVPTVATSSLRASAAVDGMPQIVVPVVDTGTFDVASLMSDVPNVDRVEAEVLTSVNLGGGRVLDVLGADLGHQQLDIVRADSGRLPVDNDEMLVTNGIAGIGDRFDVDLADGSTREMTVVGIGGTTFWNEDDVAFTSTETAAALAGIGGANWLVVRTLDGDAEALRATSRDLRTALEAADVTTSSLPITIPGGRHPIEADIDQISTLVGLLGIVAGLVALVLLASTVNTLITERTREVAIMRALGAPARQVRRRLRRLAIGIAAAAVLLGLPLGIAISNLIARLILDEFLGITPGFAVSVRVMAGSALFALLGARLVAARAAWRVTNRPLAEALRDRSGSPFGRRMTERLSVRLPLGGLLDRAALRNGVHQRARSLAMLAQITAAVAALMVVASLATSVNDYNAALLAPVQWGSRTFVPGPGLDIDLSVADGDVRSEVGADINGEVAGWEVAVMGFSPETQMIDLTMDDGRWFASPGEVAISTGFAERIGVGLGDDIEVDIASGRQTYTIVGLHPDRDRSVFVDSAELAVDMRLPGMGNVVMSLDAQPPAYMAGELQVERFADRSDDESGTTAILLIFTAIGAVVVSVAGLAVASGLAVGVYERRHEFAALRAMGARRRHVFRVVVAELLPLAVLGIGAGLIAGWWGAAAIMESFEASNAVELGFTYATGAIPAAVAVVLVGTASLGGLMVRRVSSRPAAVVLRGAA